MQKVLLLAGPEEQYGPRRIGSIISDVLRSDSPLGRSYRKRLANKENCAGKEVCHED